MTRTRTAAARRAPAPHVPRRVSGPVRPRVVPAPAGPRPARAVRPAAVPVRYRRLRALPDHHLLDSLLRSRAWIWLLGIALGGIVAMQVSLLGMNSGISQAVVKQAALEHDNATLQEQLAELSSGDRIRRAAAQEGLVSPNAGDVGFVTARGQIDARRAAERIVAPAPAVTPVPAASAATPAPASATTPAPTAAPAPVATATPVPTVVAAPVTQTAPVTTPAAPAVLGQG